MIHQYGAGRFHYSLPMVPMMNVRFKREGRKIKAVPGALRYVPQPGSQRIGTIPIGTILYIQDRIDRFNPPRFREPWIVEAWLNRKYFPAMPDAPETTYMAGGHLAIVRSLRSGRRENVSDHQLLRAEEIGGSR